MARHFFAADVNKSLWKMLWQFLIKLNMPGPHSPAMLFLGIYLRETKTSVYTKICT
jgi:hypothetical protein